MPPTVLPPAEVAARVGDVLEVPLHRFLGVELLDPGDPVAGIWFPVAEPALNNVGILHGGVVTALLDVASYLALLPELRPDENAVTHDLSVSLLRRVSAGSRVEMTGTVLRRGRSVAFLRAEARVGGDVVAAAQVTKTISWPAAD